MIQHFSTLYAGHVLEGEAIGFDGTPHDDRRFGGAPDPGAPDRGNIR